MKVYLIGVGMGNPDTMTLRGREAIQACPVLTGAPRLLETWRETGKRLVPLIQAEEIARLVDQTEEGPVGVLLSGDLGFYSGAKSLWRALDGHEVVSIPGISSLSYFCAQLGTPWQDAYVVSAHGRQADPAGAAQCHEKTFVLTGGQTRAQDVCAQLAGRGLGDLMCAVGERLSYPDERIVTGTAAELAQRVFDPLSVLMIFNPGPVGRAYAAPCLGDGDFLRGQAPMTKEEIRHLAVCRLRLQGGQVVWDVGAGTGSVSAECAQAVPDGRVFAVEREEAALALLEENRARLGLCNLTVVPGRAPEALADLPAPDRLFVGGSGGQLGEVLNLAFEKNPRARVVITAVTLETLSAAAACLDALGLADTAITQVAVTRTRQVGGLHMAQAQNPVWIISGEGRA